MKKWKKFENKTKQLLEGLHPGQKVYGNINVRGKFSKTLRQVDVQLVGAEGYDFMIFECKDKSRKIDTPTIEEFITKLQDLGATRGAIVSNSAYTSGAQNMAEHFGIDLLNLVDSSDNDINTDIYAGVLISNIVLKNFNVAFSLISNRAVTFEEDMKKIIFLDSDGDKVTAWQIFTGLWNNTEVLAKTPGLYCYAIPDDKNVAIPVGDGDPILVKNLHFNYEVSERYFFGDIKLIDTVGIYNVKEKSYRTKSLLTERIVPDEFEKTFREIESPNDASGSATFKISVKSGYSEI